MTSQANITAQKLIQGFFQLYPEEAARLLNSLPSDTIIKYLQGEPVSKAANIFSRLNVHIAVELIESMDDNFFLKLFNEIDIFLASRWLAQLDQQKIEYRLSLLPTTIAKELRELMSYPPESAGHLMDPIVATFHLDDTIEETLHRIRAFSNRRIINVMITDEEGHLIGTVSLQEIAVCPPDEKLGNLMHSNPIRIQAMSPREEVVKLLEDLKLISLPVVDINGFLLGIIRYDALVRAAKQDVSEDVQAMFGAGRDERALSKISFAIRKRLPWLELNLATAFLAAAVVGLFEATIARITVLAVFLPVVAGQSGNTGSQALAVTIRGLALREIRSKHWLRIAGKEAAVGLVNGITVATTTAVIIYIWTSSSGLSLVIGVAMIISMVIAGLAGAVIPILLQSAGQDPAQSSSIILTTVTDVVGFLSFLGLATVLAAMLGIA